MADQGLSGILIPEEFGGSNFGLSGIGVVLQELEELSHLHPYLLQELSVQVF